MVASKTIIISIIIVSIIMSSIGWFYINDIDDSIFDNNKKYKSTIISVNSTTYGHLYLQRDDRSPNVADWVSFEDYNTSFIPVSIDTDNPLEVNTIISIPDGLSSEMKGVHHYKIVFKEYSSGDTIVRNVSFRTCSFFC